MARAAGAGTTMSSSRRWPGSRPPLRSADALLIVPGLLVAAIFAVLAGAEGGVHQVDWYPATIFMIALLAVVVLAGGRALSALPRSARAAIALFGLFVAWSYASILWADDRGVAWDAANMTLLYFATFSLFAVWPWSPRAAMVVLGAFGVALAVIGWVVLVDASNARDPTAWFIKQRFAEPVGYPNGNAALFLGAAFPLVLLAARREMPWWVRGVALGAGGVLVDLSLLSQSRGSLLAGVIVLVACLAVVPGRVRTLLALATVGAVTALSVPELLDVYEVAGAGGDLSAALASASDAFLVSFVALFGFGAAAGLVETYAGLSQRSVRHVSRAVTVVAVVAGVAGGAFVLSQIGSPVSYAEERWDAFKNSEPLTPRTKGARLTASLDGRSRDEFWSVALGELAERPLGGMGAGNFALAYVRERKGFEEPTDPHSLPVRILSQTGAVGAALFLGFLVAAGAALWRLRRSPDALRRAVAAAALIAFAYWFVHSAADWLFAIPAVAGAAFAWLGMAVALACVAHPASRVALAAEAQEDDDEPAAAPARGSVPPKLLAGLLCACVLAMLAAVVPPWLAANAVDEAAATWRADAPGAHSLLDRARALNGLSDRADLIAGVIASRLGERARARRAFARAVQRSPQNWYGHQQLGLEQALAGDRRSALSQLRRARALNPREETTLALIEQIRANRRPSPERVRTVLIGRVCARVPSAGGC